MAEKANLDDETEFDCEQCGFSTDTIVHTARGTAFCPECGTIPASVVVC